MAELTIVDYNATEQSEEVLTEMLRWHGATVNDWMEKDYGLKVFVTLPDSKLSGLKQEINRTKNYNYDL